MNTHTQTSTITVPGARLRYVTQGSGPVLLLIAGGFHDAAKTRALACHLAEDYTVLTYDRRGLSGSSTDTPARSIIEHAVDASRVLAAVTAEPACVFGTSLGGLIGLNLAARHPGQVETLVAHEAPTIDLLGPEEARTARADLLAVEQAYAADGVDAALRRFMQMADLDLMDREPDVELGPPSPHQDANLEFFVRHDLPALRKHGFDMGALLDSGVRVVPVVGARTENIWAHACGRLLAEHLQVPFETFPGGHTGYVLRPRETAERLGQVLRTSAVALCG